MKKNLKAWTVTKENKVINKNNWCKVSCIVFSSVKPSRLSFHIDKTSVKKVDYMLKGQQAKDDKSSTEITYSFSNLIDLSLASAKHRQIWYKTMIKMLKKEIMSNEIEILLDISTERDAKDLLDYQHE